MSTKVSLTHFTGYTFARPVNVTPHVVRLRPAPHSRTPIEAYSLEVSPANHFVNWQQDPFGNWVARLVFPERIDHLSITVSLVADLMVINPFDFFIEASAEYFPFDYEPNLKADLAPYLRPVDGSEQTGIWKESLPPLPEGGVPTVQFLAGLNAAVHRDVAYDVRMEAGVQSPDETLDRAIGSCRDSAWLLVSLLRKYGLAARFVSGYLVQLAADQKALDGPSGTEHDFTDLHAWTEVYIPGAGWVGMDPTSALFAGEGHIPLSATPHPSSAAPIEGSTEPVEVSFEFRNEVIRVHEDPRTTKPYTQTQWSRIDALGVAVDERLDAGDVRLTMGGEPTFVALDSSDEKGKTSPEWNTDADGEHKRELAGVLAERLRSIYALGGVVHRGQGKWYPGESLPRWNIALQWRTDGEPLWQDPTLFADPWGTDADPEARANAEALGRAVTALLGIPDRRLLPAYEDPFAELAAEIRRPEGPRPELDEAGVDVADLDRDDHRRDRLGAAAHHGGRVDQSRVELPPRTARAGSRVERGGPAAAAGCDLVGGPRAPGRAVVPRGRPAAGARDPRGQGGRPEGRAHHRSDVRGARRTCARVPAAHHHPGGVLRPPPRHRGGSGPHSLPTGARGVRAAAGPAADAADRHARPRGDRGERAAHLLVARPPGADRRRCTTRRGRAGSRPRSSISTGCTPARAAAITSRWEERSRSTPRCCGAPTCWRA